jgi:hypothetical protein
MTASALTRVTCLAAAIFAVSLALSGCSLLAPTDPGTGTEDGGGDNGNDDEEAEDAPPTLEGQWIVTRVVTETSDPSVSVGDEYVRYVTFEAEDCDDDGCTGTVASGDEEDTPEDELGIGEFTQDGDDLEYTFDKQFGDCVDNTDGTVILEDAYEYVSVYTLEITDTDDIDDVDSVTEFEGESSFIGTATDEAIELGCSEEGFEEYYTVEAERV